MLSSVGSWFSKAVSPLNLHLLGQVPDWFFTGNFHCLPFNILAHSSCIFFMRLPHRKLLLFPCLGCSAALLPLAVFLPTRDPSGFGMAISCLQISCQ